MQVGSYVWSTRGSNYWLKWLQLLYGDGPLLSGTMKANSLASTLGNAASELLLSITLSKRCSRLICGSDSRQGNRCTAGSVVTKPRVDLELKGGGLVRFTAVSDSGSNKKEGHCFLRLNQLDTWTTV